MDNMSLLDTNVAFSEAEEEIVGCTVSVDAAPVSSVPELLAVDGALLPMSVVGANVVAEDVVRSSGEPEAVVNTTAVSDATTVEPEPWN